MSKWLDDARNQVHKDQLRDIQERKNLPYTITPIGNTAEFKLWKLQAQAKSAADALARREKAIAAFSNGSGDVRQAGPFKLVETPKVKEPARHVVMPINWSGFASNNTAKPSIITRIYNWFLNINY